MRRFQHYNTTKDKVWLMVFKCIFLAGACMHVHYVYWWEVHWDLTHADCILYDEPGYENTYEAGSCPQTVKADVMDKELHERPFVVPGDWRSKEYEMIFWGFLWTVIGFMLYMRLMHFMEDRCIWYDKPMQKKRRRQFRLFMIIEGLGLGALIGWMFEDPDLRFFFSFGHDWVFVTIVWAASSLALYFSDASFHKLAPWHDTPRGVEEAMISEDVARAVFEPRLMERTTRLDARTGQKEPNGS